MMQTIEDCASSAQKRTARRGHSHRSSSSNRHQAKKPFALGQSDLRERRERKKMLQTKDIDDVRLQHRPPGENNMVMIALTSSGE